jgi:hypothetical protein
MLQTGFFNSVGADRRVYDAADFARFFSMLASNGVLMNGDANALKVSALPNTLLVNVADGAALINGYSVRVSGENVAVAPTGAAPRLDRIALRLDLNQNANNIALYAKQGTPAASPAPPALERGQTDANVYELSLATISLPANAANLNGATLADDRLNFALCGVASFNFGQAFQVPAGTIEMFGGQSVPAGWLLCDGRAVSRAAYGALFAAIGTAYGAPGGADVFRLPDFRGVFPRGLDAGRGIDPGRTPGAPQAATRLAAYANSLANYPGVDYYTYSGYLSDGENAADSVGDSLIGGQSGVQRWRTSFDVRPVNLAVNFIVKY